MCNEAMNVRGYRQGISKLHANRGNRVNSAVWTSKDWCVAEIATLWRDLRIFTTEAPRPGENQ
jgi:hypothetical protein